MTARVGAVAAARGEAVSAGGVGVGAGAAGSAGVCGGGGGGGAVWLPSLKKRCLTAATSKLEITPEITCSVTRCRPRTSIRRKKFSITNLLQASEPLAGVKGKQLMVTAVAVGKSVAVVVTVAVMVVFMAGPAASAVEEHPSIVRKRM